jgi:uncharacterized protein YggU (UPF0235/DUF167 family)
MYIKAKVKVGEKKEKIEQVKEDTFLISVKEKAENNLANKRVLDLLANFTKTERKNLKIIKGHKNPSKIILFMKK